jgi:hypothetical protein
MPAITAAGDSSLYRLVFTFNNKLSSPVTSDRNRLLYNNTRKDHFLVFNITGCDLYFSAGYELIAITERKFSCSCITIQLKQFLHKQYG